MLKMRQQQCDQLAQNLFTNGEEGVVVPRKDPPQPLKMGGKGMLIIRKDQDEKLSQVSKTVFEDRMTKHLEKHFPAHYKALGEGNCRELIRYGMGRAATHDFVSERDVCKFIDLMICFGVDFDADVKQSWATVILANTSWVNATAKMVALFEAGIVHLKNNPR